MRRTGSGYAPCYLYAAMSIALMIVLGFVGIFVISFVGIILLARRHVPAIMAARRAFFEQTGYRHPGLVAASIEEQVQFVPRMTLKTREERYVRRLDSDHEVSFLSSSVREPGRIVRRLSWSVPLAHSPAVVLQIADRSLSSFGKTAREALTRSSRTWSPIYPPVALADAELDARFVAFGPDPEAVKRCVVGLRELLLACKEVDLIVTPTEIRFSDPSDQNLSAAHGGTTGRIAAGMNPAPTILSSIPVHQRINEILERALHATASTVPTLSSHHTGGPVGSISDRR